MPHWRDRLSAAQRRVYDKSAAITSIRLRPSTELLQSTAALSEALKQMDRTRIQELSQKLVNEICRCLNVPSVKVKVAGVRPSNASGALLWGPTSRTYRTSGEVPQSFARIPDLYHRQDSKFCSTKDLAPEPRRISLPRQEEGARKIETGE